MKISDVAKLLNVGIDTLRYYEKIHLLEVARTASGIRIYSDKDLAKIRFIRQAQRIGFSLSDIAQLMHFRENPATTKPQVRA